MGSIRKIIAILPFFLFQPVIFAQIAISISGTIAEGSENNGQIVVALTGYTTETFEGSLDETNWTVANLPDGVSVETPFVRDNNYQVTINLSGNRTRDYDTDITDVSVTVTNNEIFGYAGADLSDNTGVLFDATNDDEEISVADDINGIAEAAEDGEIITVTLTGGTFIPVIDTANYVLTNLPEGVERDTVIRTSATTVDIYLKGNRSKDYDTDITDLIVSVDAAEIDDYTGVDLESDGTGVLFDAAVDGETIAIDDDGSITEGAEDGEIITATLSGGTFIKNINPNNFSFTNLPAGVTKGTVTRTDSVTVTIALANNRTTDYDANITNLILTVAASEIDDHTGAAIQSTTSGVEFTAVVEPVTLAMTYDGTINEAAENGEVITVTVSEDTFVDPLTKGNWTLSNLPGGVDFSLNRTSATTVEITLSGNRTVDYDTDKSLGIEIDDAELVISTGSSKTATGTVTFKANNDTESISMSDDASGILEGAEGGEIITVTLTGGTFVQSLTPSAFTLSSNLPTGVTRGTPNRVSATVVTIPLVGNRTLDYDSDITNVSLTVNASQIDDHTSPNLTTSGGVVFSANDETLNISASPALTEDNLDGASVTLTLIEETFADLSLNASNFTLNNAPPGTTIGGFTNVTSTGATMNLLFDDTDFDTDYSNFSVTVNAFELSGVASVTSNALTITAVVEDAQLSMLVYQASEILEGQEHGKKIRVTVAEDQFTSILNPANWTLTNLPGGVLWSLTRVNSTNVDINLIGNRTEDYDVNITNFTVEITAAEFVNLSSGSLSASSGVLFRATNDNETLSILSDGLIEEGKENGEVLSLNLSGGTFVNPPVASNFTLLNLPTGVSRGSVIWSSTTQVYIQLSGNRTIDYDEDIDISVRVDETAFDDYTGIDLEPVIKAARIFANVESATLNADPDLSEDILDGATVSITLYDETFTDGTLLKNNFVLNNPPTGLTINTVSYVSPTSANVLFDFTEEDFDENILDFSITINAAELTGIDTVQSNDILITAVIEPVLISPGTLAPDNSYVTVTFSEAVYSENNMTGIIVPEDFNLIYTPNGSELADVTIASVTNNAGGPLVAGEDVVRVYLDYGGGVVEGNETVEIRPNVNALFDWSGNAVASTQTTGALPLVDLLLPTFTVNVRPDNNIRITFSEDVADALGNDLEFTDFSVDIAEGIVTNADIGPLAGLNKTSQSIWVMNLDLQSIPNGLEEITVDVLPNTVYDLALNVTPSDPKTKHLRDKLSPEFSAEVLDTNTVKIVFNENVVDTFQNPLTIDVFDIDLVGGNAAIGSPVLESVSDSIYIIDLDLSDLPDGDEELTLDVTLDSVRDTAGNFVINNPQSGLLKDKKPPEYSIVVDVINTITVTFTEPVEDINGDPLSIDVFDLSLSGGVAVLGTPFISDYSETEYVIDLDLQNVADGSEQLTFNVLPDAIFDAKNNAAIPVEIIETLNDNTYPVFDIFVALDNKIQVNFTEDVTDNLGGDLLITDFDIVLDGGSSTIGTPVLEKISQAEWSIDLDLQTPPNGLEEVTIDVVENSIFDLSDNPVQSAPKTKVLNDKLSPVFFVQVTTNNRLRVTFTEPVSDAGNQDLQVSDFEITLSGGNADKDSVTIQKTNDSIYVIDLDLVGVTNGEELISLNVKSNTIYDLSDNPVVPNLKEVHLRDNTAPSNQNIVFSSDTDKKGGVAVTIVSSGEVTNKIWFAPLGTKVFTPGPTKTTTTGLSTTINSPLIDGEYYLYIIDSVGNISNPSIAVLTVDNQPPVVDSVFVVGGEYSIGDEIQFIIYADTSGYVAGNILLNEVNAIQFENPDSNRYTVVYKVAEGNVDRFTADDIPISVSLMDAAGNMNDPYTDTLRLVDTNDVVIFANSPTATLIEGGSACFNDDSELDVILSGYAPWNIVISNGAENDSIFNIETSPYHHLVSPDTTTTYTIVSVQDSTPNMNTGEGAAKINVYPITEVNITQPPVSPWTINYEESSYFELKGEPINGIFNGNGVVPSGVDFRFYPIVAGIGKHNIVYAFADTYGCTNRDTVIINVTNAPGDVLGLEPLHCYNDSAFLITGLNSRDSTGTFTLYNNQGPIEGNKGLIDLGNNTAMVYPQILKSGNFVVNYQFVYEDTFEIPKAFFVEYINEPRFINFTTEELCKNGNPITLIGNYDDLDGEFSWIDTAGVVRKGNRFIPSEAPLGVNIINYSYTSVNGCQRDTTESIFINDIPVVDFTVDNICIDLDNNRPIQFNNLTTSSDPIRTGDGWLWNFNDDVPINQNTSNDKNPTHLYAKVDDRDVSLTATTTKGCTVTRIREVNFGKVPKADFSWTNECFVKSEAIEFTNESGPDDVTLTNFVWKFYKSVGFDEVTTEDATYKFTRLSDYNIELIAETDLGCRDTTLKTIHLRPLIKLADSAYFEDFEDGNGGWLSGAFAQLGVDSWVLGDPDGDIIDTASSGTNAWFTKREESLDERSWVSSPCFDFTGLERPMIKLDLWRVFDIGGREGSNIQWTDNDGLTWTNIGNLSTGINWYNSYGINGNPGGVSIGWADQNSSGDKNWVVARHTLDNLKNKERVRFRVNFGSVNSIKMEGMAFDNIWIGTRSKKVLVEHFTNSSDENSAVANRMLDSVLRYLPEDAIDIQYHTSFPDFDKLNAQNTEDPSGRVLHYKVSSVPYSIIDGGFRSNYNIAYNTVSTIEKTPLALRVLEDAIFDIELDLQRNENSINVQAEIKALKDIPDAELTLHMAVVEKEVFDPLVAGTNGEEWFRNVLKKLLPNAGGTSLSKSWAQGESTDLSFAWNYKHVFNKDSIHVVAFIQDLNTQEVYQVETTDSTGFAPIVSIDHIKESLKSFTTLMYPNPSAIGKVYLQFNKPLDSRTMVRMYNQLGIPVYTKELTYGISQHEINTSGLPKGIYFVELVSEGYMKKVSKIILNH